MLLSRRCASPGSGLALLAVVSLVFWLYTGSRTRTHPGISIDVLPLLMKTALEPQTVRIRLDSDDRNNRPRKACKSARGILLDADNKYDVPVSSELPGITFPVPTMGSFDALKLSKTWMTFAQRYGPYGYGKTHSEIDWDKVDWGQLQDECAISNSARFGLLTAVEGGPRFRFVDQIGPGTEPPLPRQQTSRQAIVVRTWSMYEYHPEDMWNLRSLINEAALAQNGDYQVFLLVDLKCGDDCKDVHSNSTMYQTLLKRSVPKEFRNISILYHESLLRDWYSKVDEVRSMWQIMQPLQLFAHFYPEYDHYWQIEMDTRFTGHVGDLLEAFHNFGKDQPYKQARERASWAYMPGVHGTYDEFSTKINASLDGGARVWGADKIRLVTPIGPDLPADPKLDDFRIGRGEDADLLLFGQLNDVRRFERHPDWVFKDWVLGFGDYVGMPRYMSVPAQARASYDLLESIHRSQHGLGLRVASEATLPSWALWLGLKVVGLPFPKFMYPERKLHEINYVQNGELPEKSKDGVAKGPGIYRASSLGFFTRPVTFDWWSTLCDPIYEHWMGTYENKTIVEDFERPDYVVVPNELPGFMTEVGDEIFIPNLLLHPRKSNAYHAPG